MNASKIETQKSKIACDGGIASSHPKIWLQIDEQTKEATCPYCGVKFVKTGSSHEAH